MRLNVYSQELITGPEDDEAQEVVEATGKMSDAGIFYGAVRLYLHSSDRLHHPNPLSDDDDRSAITFWLPRSPARREYLAETFEELAKLVRNAPPETGLD